MSNEFSMSEHDVLYGCVNKVTIKTTSAVERLRINQAASLSEDMYWFHHLKDCILRHFTGLQQLRLCFRNPYYEYPVAYRFHASVVRLEGSAGGDDLEPSTWNIRG